MFLDFFFALRSYKVPVTTTEYLDLINVVNSLTSEGEHISSKRFYYLARLCMVKNLKHYDLFDQCFAAMFGEMIESDSHFRSLLDEWLKEAKKFALSDQRKRDAMKLPSEDLIKELEKRLREQKERHDGGNKWIGTGGTSAFGHSGFNPAGMRIGGNSMNKSALVVAGERKFKDYRTDRTLNIRQIKMALKGLRLLSKKGRPQISIKKSIEKTCDQGGEIEIVEEPTRKNNMKVVLLMDVGGSMTVHSKRVNDLFSALHQVNHFKQFEAYYFHNIFYDHFYTSANLNFDHQIEIDKFYKKHDSTTRVIIVGDSYMAPYELFNMNGEMRNYYDYFGRVRYSYEREKSPIAIDRVRQFSEKYPHTVWLNPEQKSLWSEPTIRSVKREISMHRLSLDGLKESVDFLKS